MNSLDTFLDALSNPLAFAELVRVDVHYFRSHLQTASEAKSSSEVVKNVVDNFRIFANLLNLTTDHFKGWNATGITTDEFKTLTNSKVLSVLEMPGGPDDIEPIDKVQIIETWKFVALSSMFSHFCQCISTIAILKGFNIEYIMGECKKGCAIHT